MHDKEIIHLLQGLLIAALTLLNSQSIFHTHIHIAGHISSVLWNITTIEVSLHLN